MHNQGMTILMEELSMTEGGHGAEAYCTYNVVIPTTNQKSCWRNMCRALACQVWVSVLYESPRIVKTPESTHQYIRSLQRKTLLTGENKSGPPEKPMMTLENAAKILTDVARW